MTKKQPEMLDTRIRSHYESMPPSEKRLADLLLTFPGDITDYSASELCELAKTSKAAATRFFSRLGYKDFNEARKQAREARKWGAPLYQSSHLKQSKSGLTGEKEYAEHYLSCEQANLSRTIEQLSKQQLELLTQALANKKRVHIIGYRNNRFLAEYLWRQMSILRDQVYLRPASNQSIAEELISINQDDLVVVLGMRRRTAMVDRIIDFANLKNAPVALIADATATNFETRVCWQIQCELHSEGSFDSYTSVLSVIGLLVHSVYEKLPNAVERIRAIESAHDELGELKLD